MQLRYVFSETGSGLKRNVSMSIALIVTIFVSLSLVGMGLLLNAQADKAERFWGNKLQITVFMCNQNSKAANCTGEVTPTQLTAIKGVIDENPEVASFYHQSKDQAFKTWKKVYISKDKSEQEIYSTVTAAVMQES
jgi:cell division transport system permease protein